MAGGAWVPEPGDGSFDLRMNSRKHAASSWDAFGEQFDNPSQHDFRYAYLNGDVGLFRNLSAQFLLTFLDGREGPPGEHERNVGFSDAWFGLKYQLRRGAYPMALGASLRTPMFYDREGPYNRWRLFDSQGRIAGLNDEWRGVLKYDYSIQYSVSRSFLGGAGWANFTTGYTWRTGSPADQNPRGARGGLPAAVVRSGGQGPGSSGSGASTTTRATAGYPTTGSAATRPSASTTRAWDGWAPLDHPDSARPAPQLERGGRLQQVGLGPLRPQLPGAVLLDWLRVLTSRSLARDLAARTALGSPNAGFGPSA